MKNDSKMDFETFQTELIELINFVENSVNRVDKVMERIDARIASVDDKFSKPPKK